MSNNHAEALAALIGTRSPRRIVIRGSLGDGQGIVEHATLADTVYVRLHDSESSLVIARNLNAPSLNDVAVDVERRVEHSKTLYTILGLTQGVNLPAGTNPYANVVLHGHTHAPQGYDPIIGYTHTVALPTTDYRVKNEDSYIGVSGTLPVQRIITLPMARDVIGQSFTFKDQTGAAGGAFDVRINTQNGELIENTATFMSLNTNYSAKTIISDGVGWWTLAVY